MGTNNKIDLESLMPQDAYSQEILQARSKALAMVEDNHNIENVSKISYIKFSTRDHEYYGIPYHDIQDIKGIKNVSRIPKSPAYITGISYWHGKIIPIIDLATYFGINNTPLDLTNSIIATTAIDDIIIGYAFQEVAGVDSYQHEQLDKSLHSQEKIKNSFIHGIHHGSTTILNIKEISQSISAELMNKEVKYHE